MILKEKCYDIIEKGYGARPTPHFADYERTLEALKVLKEKDILTIVGDAVFDGKKKTLREMLTERSVDIYRQENL